MSTKPKGLPKTGGRKKGTKNKLNPVRDKAEELGIDPWEILLYFAKGDWKALGYESEKILVHSKEYTNEEFVIPPAVRAKCAASACEYIQPKLKAIEHTGNLENAIQAQVIILPSNGREKK